MNYSIRCIFMLIRLRNWSFASLSKAQYGEQMEIKLCYAVRRATNLDFATALIWRFTACSNRSHLAQTATTIRIAYEFTQDNLAKDQENLQAAHRKSLGQTSHIVYKMYTHFVAWETSQKILFDDLHRNFWFPFLEIAHSRTHPR